MVIVIAGGCFCKLTLLEIADGCVIKIRVLTAESLGLTGLAVKMDCIYPDTRRLWDSVLCMSFVGMVLNKCGIFIVKYELVQV